jgi:hypothetical protein
MQRSGIEEIDRDDAEQEDGPTRCRYTSISRQARASILRGKGGRFHKVSWRSEHFGALSPSENIVFRRETIKFVQSREICRC